jgi:hypothetical protein
LNWRSRLHRYGRPTEEARAVEDKEDEKIMMMTMTKNLENQYEWWVHMMNTLNVQYHSE